MSFVVLHFKNFIYTLTCTVNRGGASILSLGNMSTKEKSLCQTVTMKKTSCQVKVCKKLSPCQLEGSKKTPQPKG